MKTREVGVRCVLRYLGRYRVERFLSLQALLCEGVQRCPRTNRRSVVGSPSPIGSIQVCRLPAPQDVGSFNEPLLESDRLWQETVFLGRLRVCAVGKQKLDDRDVAVRGCKMERGRA